MQEQFGRDSLQTYPRARILATSSHDVDKIGAQRIVLIGIRLCSGFPGQRSGVGRSYSVFGE